MTWQYKDNKDDNTIIIEVVQLFLRSYSISIKGVRSSKGPFY